MRIYHAGSSTREPYGYGLRRALLSFASSGKSDFDFWVREQVPGAEVFLDSGAFSVMQSGAAVDLQAYCDFCHMHRNRLETYVQLDVIGDQRATRANLAAMEARGLRPMPVFTASGDVGELDELCSRYRHIGLGDLKGRQMFATGWRSERLDRVFRVAERHWPVRFHAFGLIAQGPLERYPFYSADSASVTIGGANGILLREASGQYAWMHWRDEVRRTGDAALADPVPGNDLGSTRRARWRRSLETAARLERYVTDLWEARGVTFREVPHASVQ